MMLPAVVLQPELWPSRLKNFHGAVQEKILKKSERQIMPDIKRRKTDCKYFPIKKLKSMA
jgi:hypothetical protein